MRSLEWSKAVIIAFAWPVLACGRNEPPPQTEFPTIDPIPQGPAAPSVVVRTYGKSGPVDQGGYHPDFVAFRNELMRIAERRDTLALFAAVSPDVKLSFGGDTGLQGLRDYWRISSPDSELWGVLRDIALSGGKFAGDDSFTAPWTFFGLPDSLDAFTHVIVRAEDVAVYERPDLTSAVLGRLSYDIVRAGTFEEGTAFRTIALSDGTNGYADASRIRGPLDYRATFERRNGRWWLVSLVSGD